MIVYKVFEKVRRHWASKSLGVVVVFKSDIDDRGSRRGHQ